MILIIIAALTIYGFVLLFIYSLCVAAGKADRINERYLNERYLEQNLEEKSILQNESE
jgi:hypothetical protein